MGNVFDNAPKATESWSASGATLVMRAGKTELSNFADLVVTGVTIQFARRVNPIYPIATAAKQSKKINILGAPQGTLSIQSILGPNSKAISTLIEKTGKSCKGPDDQVTFELQPFSAECKPGGTAGDTKYNSTWTLSGVELESTGISIQGGEISMVNMPLSFSFTDLKLS